MSHYKVNDKPKMKKKKENITTASLDLQNALKQNIKDEHRHTHIYIDIYI